jgi:arabinofuranan 3-O-arabinosyltransferase
VITGADDDISRSGALAPAAAAQVLAGQGLHVPTQSYGPVTQHPPAEGQLGPGASLPQVRRYDIPAGRGIVGVDPVADPTIVDGSARSLAAMAAFGTLPSTTAILYAGDQSQARLRALAAGGANVVVGDSNRRQEFLPESTQQNQGLTLAAGDPIPAGAAEINAFPGPGTNGQTVAALQGARYLHTPVQPGELQFPETSPIAAFDGNLQTAWVADRNLPVADRWMEVGFTAPRAVRYVDVYPLNDPHGTVTEVDVNGVQHQVGPGWTRIGLHLRSVSALRFTITGLRQPSTGLAGAGGFREIRIPGFHVRQWLRSPVVVGRDLAGTDLGRDSLSYVFERTTGDDPFQRNPYGTNTLLDQPTDRGDAEQQIQRIVFAPATRSYTPSTWVQAAVPTPDSTLDRLAGYRGADRFDSSSRFDDTPAYRASSAFAAVTGPTRRTGWIGFDQGGAGGPGTSPWIRWSTPRPLRVSQLRLSPSSAAVRHPTRVRVSWPGGETGALTVAPGGTVTLPRPMSATSFRLTVVASAFAPGTTARQRHVQAVGIATLSVPGLSAPAIPATGALQASCGTVAISVGGRRVPMAPVGTVAQLDAGRPLPARACGGGPGTVSMAAGVEHITSLPGTFSVDLLRLASPAPTPVAAASPTGRVVNAGRLGDSSVDGVKVALSAPSWLVLGQSYDAGWQATCDGRSLGAPQTINGYANGWLAPAGCTRVAFTFGPQGGVNHSYVLSALACALMLLLLIVGAFRRPTRAVFAPRPPAAGPGLDRESALIGERGARRSLPVAAALGLAVAIPLGYLFAIRAGAALFVLVTLVLWRGYRTRTLIVAGAALLGLAVPLAYVIAQPRNQGGYGFGYATQTIAAHWLGVAAVVLLALSLWRIIRGRAGGARQDRQIH